MGSKRKRSSNQDAPGSAPPAKKTQVKPAPKPALIIDSSPFLEAPKGADLKREVQLYDLLSSEDGAERLVAANAIVSGLLSGEGVEEATLKRHLERRLFRGLASGRKGARLGFGIVITEILGQLLGEKNLAGEKYAGLSFDKTLDLLLWKTKPEGDLSGQEEKDHHIGLLFGLQSFVRARVLFREEGLWVQILSQLLGLAQKKPWIRKECGWVVVEALEQMDPKQAEMTLSMVFDAGLALSPEGVGIWLTAKGRFPDMEFPSKPWGPKGDPLGHLDTLAKVMKESSSTKEGLEKGNQTVQTGIWNPQLHFAWGMVLSQFAKSVEGRKKNKGPKSDFETFWKVVVDGKCSSSIF